jgi:putative MATE family efflux protein
MHEKDRIKTAVSTAMLTALVSGFLLIFVGLFLAVPMLRLLSTPEDVLDMATEYMRIYFIGMPFFMIYNFGSAILRSVGDTRRPLISLVLSGVLNIILNLFFVIVCDMGVAGVATATVISNALSSALVVIFLIREKSEIRFDLHCMKIDFGILKQMISIGVPAGVQGMVFSISNVCIQSFINAFGSTVVAASAAALNFEMYEAFMITAFGQAATTFSSQNYGAGKYDRCHRSYLLSVGMGMAASFLLSCLFLIFGKFFLGIFTSDAEVVRYGLIRMRYLLTLEFFNALLDITAGALRGIGRSSMPAIISIAGVCGVRLIYVYTIFRFFNSYNALMVIYPVSWIVTAAIMVLCYFSARRKLSKLSSVQT